MSTFIAVCLIITISLNMVALYFLVMAWKYNREANTLRAHRIKLIESRHKGNSDNGV